MLSTGGDRSAWTYTPAPLRRRAEATAPSTTRSRSKAIGRVLVAGTLLAFAIAGTASPMLRAPVTDVASQAQFGVGQAASTVAVAWQAHTRTAALIDEVQVLRSEREQLQLDLMATRAALAEADRVAGAVALARTEGLTGTTARVIGHGATLRLDRGEADGVTVGSTAITGDGIVGQITAVGPSHSELLPIADRRHALQVRIEGVAKATTATGTGDALTLPHLLATAPIEVDALVFSTGVGGVFPADLPVGVVESIAQSPDGPFLQVQLRPTASVEALSEVMVLTR
ncbi:MAG: rod shape-determining protein MreC [Proteobacteria bacterium]|nr:rod shape-determining protein MreC [Pseudomonadota bacterium]